MACDCPFKNCVMFSDYQPLFLSSAAPTKPMPLICSLKFFSLKMLRDTVLPHCFVIIDSLQSRTIVGSHIKNYLVRIRESLAHPSSQSRSQPMRILAAQIIPLVQKSEMLLTLWSQILRQRWHHVLRDVGSHWGLPWCVADITEQSILSQGDSSPRFLACCFLYRSNPHGP